jgi:hypothetical protein
MIEPQAIEEVPAPRPARWWIHLCGFVVSAYVLASVAALYIAELSQSEGDERLFLQSEGLFRVGGAAAFALMAFLPYSILSRAASRARHERLVLIVACGCAIVDLVLRTRFIFFPQISTDGIAALVLPMWLIAVAVAVWMVVTYIGANASDR